MNLRTTTSAPNRIVPSSQIEPDASPLHSPQAVRLLVSVRDGQEAWAAIQGGADWIDVKNPSAGPLGRPSWACVRDVVEACRQAAEQRREPLKPISVALGELPELEPSSLAELPAGVAWVKAGVAGADPGDFRSSWPRRMDEAVRALPTRVRFVMAAYADAQRLASCPGPGGLARAVEMRFGDPRLGGLLIDTAVKDGTNLFDWLSRDQLQPILARLRRVGLPLALAGSLRSEAFGRAVSLRPDVVAVRGAACEGNDRGSSVSAARVADLRRGLCYT